MQHPWFAARLGAELSDVVERRVRPPLVVRGGAGACDSPHEIELMLDELAAFCCPNLGLPESQRQLMMREAKFLEMLIGTAQLILKLIEMGQGGGGGEG